MSTSGKPHSPSEQAQAWQGKGDYPGVDDHKDITLKKGTVVYGSYVVKEDTPAAIGVTKANPQHGPGGTPQLFIPDHKNALEPIETNDLSP